MFCLAMRRDAYERIGPLDQRFEVGLLEDDDYSMRARAAGYRLVCAEDVLVHHFGETSFGKLVPTGEYNEILAANKQRFEEKWGEPWQPYERRLEARLRAASRERIRAIVAETLPAGRDGAGREPRRRGAAEARRAPRLALPAGRRTAPGPAIIPPTASEAVAQLEAMRATGGQFLLVPQDRPLVARPLQRPVASISSAATRRSCARTTPASSSR